MFNKTFEALLEMRRAEISAVTGIAEAQGWRPTMEDAAVVDAAAVARRPGGENPLVLAVLWPLHGGRHKYADAAKNIYIENGIRVVAQAGATILAVFDGHGGAARRRRETF